VTEVSLLPVSRLRRDLRPLAVYVLVTTVATVYLGRHLFVDDLAVPDAEGVPA
jgi:hypothetical protein